MTIHKDSNLAVIWDFGGVIVRTHDQRGRAQWEKKLGLPANKLSEWVFEGEMGRKASLGQATTDEVWNWVIEQLELPPETRVELERDFWKGDRLDEALVAFIRDLRPTYKTGLLSNAWPDLRKALENVWNVADAFDEIVISAEVGFVKPDARIYHQMLDRLNVPPERAIFVDDFPENIAGAHAVGMQAVRFKNPKQALRDLRAVLNR